MPDRSASSGTYRERNTTADRVLDILLLYSGEKPVWTGNEIAIRLGVARSTGYRYLQSLVGAGFVEETGGGFRLGRGSSSWPAQPAGAVCAAISIAAPASRVPPAELRNVAAEVRTAADTVSRELELHDA